MSKRLLTFVCSNLGRGVHSGAFTRSAPVALPLVRQPSTQLEPRNVKVASKWSNFAVCGTSRTMHTQGDQELTEFLKEEIKIEKKNVATEQIELPGFSLEKCEDCEVSFVKKSGNETVRVKFNVNDSLDNDQYPEEYQEDDENMSKLQSRPPFIVEIDKGSDSILEIYCSVAPPTQEQEEAEGEVLEIINVNFKSGEEVNEKSFVLSGSIMDPNMYEMLLNTLEERGIDVNFVDALVEVSTGHEQKMYINFLEKLQSFLNTK